MTEQSELRKSLRSKILATRDLKRYPITFQGVEIELKQPTIEQVQEFQNELEAKHRLIRMLIKFAFVPGTDEKVFEDGDLDELKIKPFTSEVSEMLNIFTGFLTGDVREAEKN